jgi:hypothetical protein
MSWVDSIFYEWTNLISNGPVVTLLDVPFAGVDQSGVCNMCVFGYDPCTDFDSPIDVIDCNGDVCSDFDYCADIHLREVGPLEITDAEGYICP